MTDEAPHLEPGGYPAKRQYLFTDRRNQVAASHARRGESRSALSATCVARDGGEPCGQPSQPNYNCCYVHLSGADQRRVDAADQPVPQLKDRYENRSHYKR